MPSTLSLCKGARLTYLHISGYEYYRALSEWNKGPAPRTSRGVGCMRKESHFPGRSHCTATAGVESTLGCGLDRQSGTFFETRECEFYARFAPKNAARNVATLNHAVQNPPLPQYGKLWSAPSSASPIKTVGSPTEKTSMRRRRLWARAPSSSWLPHAEAADIWLQYCSNWSCASPPSSAASSPSCSRKHSSTEAQHMIRTPRTQRDR